MRIKAGFNLGYTCLTPTPMLLSLEIHPSRRQDLLTEQVVRFEPAVDARRRGGQLWKCLYEDRSAAR